MPRTSLRLVLPLLILAGFHSGAMACNYPPVAVISGTDPVWLHVGHEWCFNGSNSYDPDGWIALWLWNWDDGSSSSGSGTPPLCVYHAWSEVDEYDPFLYVRDNLGAGDYEWMDVYVAAMGWSIPSPFIPVNDDDDDENGRMDRYNDGPVPGGDDDLMPWQISVNAPTDGDEVTLGLSHHYCLRVWDEPTREGLFIDVADHSETWAAGNWSRTVCVEGVSPSGESNRPMLTWYYFGDGYFSLQGWNGEPPSQIEPYVVHVDMDMQAVEDDFAEDGGQFTEETTPGGFIPLDECEELTIRAVKPFVTSIPNWAEITLDVEYYGAGRIRVWADQNKTQEITLPHTFEPPAYTTHTVYVEGESTSSFLRDTVLTLTHTVTSFQDKINLTVVELDIVSVPEYLFASATYATPIKFTVKGLGGYAYIHDIEADLYLNGMFEKTIYIGQRFAAGDGDEGQCNGRTNTYTCYINHTEYSSVAIHDTHRTDDVHFVLRVDCSPNGSNPITIESAPDDEDAKPKLFADQAIFAAEPGIGTQVYSYPPYIRGFNSEVELGGASDYQHWEKGNIGPYCDPSVWSYNPSHEECMQMEDLPNGRIGVNYCWSVFGSDAHEQLPWVSSTEMGVRTRLFDDNDMFADPPGPADVGMKNRFYAFRRGAYFCPSYGGKQVDVLPVGEYTMDLSKTQGTYNWKLFETSQIRFSNVCDSSSGLSIGTVANLCGLGWAVASASTPWSTAFGTAAGVFNMLDDADQDSQIDDRAHGVAYVRFVADNFGTGSHVEENRMGPYQHSADGTLAPLTVPIARAVANWVVGDCYTFYVELESACSERTRELFAAEARSQVELGCIGNQNITAQDDFQTWYLELRCP